MPKSTNLFPLDLKFKIHNVFMPLLNQNETYSDIHYLKGSQSF